MSFADTLKAKKNIIILVVAAIVLAAVVVTQLLPSGEEKPIGPPPIVAKKAKITPPDEAAKAVPVPVQPVAGAPAGKKPRVMEAKAPAVEEKKPAIRVETAEREKPAPSIKTAETGMAKTPVAKKGAKRWAVHVASLSYENEAKHFASKLKKAGYNAYVTEFTKDGVVWYRVRAGFYSSRKEAQGAAKKIESKLNVKSSAWTVLAPKNEVSKYAR